MSLGASESLFCRLSRWTKLQALFAEWRQRVRPRYGMEHLSERDLADMRLTRFDVPDETQKPFWQQ
ncbi:MAG: DUF1127 domain-containing protein [Xanthobacteraceae bacterium]